MSINSSNDRLIVTALLEAKPGMEELLRTELILATEAERDAGLGRGLISYDLHRDRINPARLLTYEVWESRQRFDEFQNTHRPPELLSFLARADQWVTQPVDRTVTYWDMLGQDAL